MGGVLSGFFQSGSHFLAASGLSRVSEQTSTSLKFVFEVLQTNPGSSPTQLESLLSEIPKGDNILAVTDDDGFNLLQKAVGANNYDLVRWVLSQRGCDVNRGVCSLPLHIACLKGYRSIVELLLKHSARIDTEARLCWPGPHNQTCEMRGINEEAAADRSSDKIQSAVCYAIDGDQAGVLELLVQQGEDTWFPWQQKRPLLHLACERGAWNCVKYLVNVRQLEINQCCDEYYPIHQAALHDLQFCVLLINSGADVKVRTSTQQMTVLHVVFLLGKKSAEGTLTTVRLLLENGARQLINAPDSLGNTPLHALIVRYALEEARFGYDHEPAPWNKWDMLHIMRFLLQNGASPSINHPGNSALACVLRHVRDWEFRYELLDMLLQNGGNPDLVGRDGSVPLMVCLVPLINKNPLCYLTHMMKVFYLNCVRLLCRFGANPNCCSRGNLTPLHILVFTASEYMTVSRVDEKAQAFAFIQQLLMVLLQYGLDPNIKFSQRASHILLSLTDMVTNARGPEDLRHIYDLTRTLLQFGANPNVNISSPEPMICHSQSSLYLKKLSCSILMHYVHRVLQRDDFLQDSLCRYERLIRLYYCAMDHQELFSCLKMLSKPASHLNMKQPLWDLIRELYTTPRSLKQISRVCIYNSLRVKSIQNVNKLQLPVPLRDYILNWDP